MRLAPYDELEVIREQTELILNDPTKSVRQKRSEIADIFLELLIAAYLYGIQDAAELLGLDDIDPDQAAMQNTVFHVIDGLNFEDRINNHIPEDGEPSLDRLMILAESEITWDYNQAGLWVAHSVDGRYGLKVYKTWNTMMDEKVRDSHNFLEGVTIPVLDLFHTFDGDSASAPGGFTDPANNVNCRCWLTYTYNP